MKLRAILVDDEAKAIHLLQSKLNQYCPEILIEEVFTDPEEAVSYLQTHKVEILFLDVTMPKMNGFELLTQLDNPSFELVFVTAYDEFALEAIRHCAIGYLLKPIDKDDLLEVVKNVRKNYNAKNALLRNEVLLNNLDRNSYREKKVVVPSTEGLIFFQISKIIYFEGIDGYTKIYSVDEEPFLSSYNIGHFSKMLENTSFHLVHKSYLVNIDFVTKYTNEGYLHLNGEHSIPVSRRKRKEVLELFK